MSCSRCHLPALYATDALPRSLGVHDQRVPRNAPTVLNAALYFKQHWDGQFASVEEQATRALLGPAFGSPDYPTAMARVKAIPGYAEMFQLAFPGEAKPVSEDNWGKAIGAYERTLVSTSRFDDYLSGKSDSLSAADARDYERSSTPAVSSATKGLPWADSGSGSSVCSPTTGRRPAARISTRAASG